MRTWALSQWWLGMVGLITIAVLTGMSHGGVPVRPYRVAVLTTGAITLPIMDGLREGLAQLGYAEGTALTFVVEDTHGTVVQLDRHLARLIAAHPDVIMTIGTVPTVAAKQATTTIPIVFTLMNSKSLRPTNCAAFIRLSTSHTSSAANLPGGSSAMQGFSRGAEAA